jgi:tetratricopeptide (TPR) repeat protein
MKLYKQAKEIFEKQQDAININVVNIRLGNFLLSSKRFSDASVEYRKALLFAKKMNNIRQISNIYNNLGITYMELNRLDSAFYYIEESHKINMTLGIVDRKPAYLHNIGKCYYKKNNFEQAILYADSSFYMGKQNLNLMIQRDALKLLREIYQSKKNYEKALEYALLFSETDKKVFDEEKLKKIQQIYTLYEIEKRNHQIELLELKKKKQQTLTYYLIGIIGLIICVFIIFYQKQKRDKLTLLMKNELQNMQTRLEKAEKEKVEAKFLRMQISPHFLFNTLNNLFSLAIKNDDQITASGISKLSNLTRYLLYQSKQEEVSLESEIFIIENYIGLQNLRINEKDDVEIIFTQDIEDIETYYIAPNILITFVENAFKYGILPQKKSQIIINMSSINNMMYFMVQNTKHSNLHPAKETSMSIGLDNAKKQLEKLYPNQYDLEIENEIHFFRIQLQIRLHKTDI